MRTGVVVFPGSNCDMDTYHVIGAVLGLPVQYVWHQERNVDGFDCLVLPGGFSYGDYLRTGAIARFSPVMEAVAAFADRGGLVLGICNGFQILQEAGLLPGAMQRNCELRFVCSFTHIRVENDTTAFTRGLQPGQVLKIPVAHGDGNFFADPETLAAINAAGRVVFRYCTPDGQVSPAACPNGSLENIAGVANARGNVVGLMPHPERAAEAVLGSEDGRLLFQAAVQALAEGGVARG